MRIETVDSIIAFLSARRMNAARVLFVAEFGKIFFRFASNIVLTRLLFPEAFTIMVLVGAAIMIVEFLTETGIGHYMVRQEDAFKRDHQDAIWTLLLMRGTVITAILFFSAPIMGWVYGVPELVAPLQVTSIYALLQGACSLRMRYFQRTGREGYNAIVEMGAYLVQLATMLGLAAWGHHLHTPDQMPQLAEFLYSHWPLVLGGVVFATVRLIASYVLYPDPWHKLRLDKEAYRRLWQFSRFFLMSSMITLAIKQFDKIYLPRMVGLSDFALYALAFMIVLAFETVIDQYYTRVYYSNISKRMRDGESGPDVYYGCQWRPRLALVFICAGGVFGGKALFEVLYDERYLGAGVFFGALVIKCILKVWSQGAESYLLSANKPHAKLVAEVLRLVWVVPGIMTGFHFFGLFGAALGFALIDILVIPYYYFLLWRLKTLRLWDEILTIAAMAAGILAGYFGLQLYNATIAQYFVG
ncbi:MAG: oligosaccharide flippase family protein [Pseudomonadota bacterium]